MYFAAGSVLPVPLFRLQPTRPHPIEQWPWLEQDVLIPSRSRQVCLTGQLHQGLIAAGEHITHRCPGWTDNLHRQRG